MNLGAISGQSFVAGGSKSKALLDLLAERLQPNALLYMMSCHAGVCPRRTNSQQPEPFQIEGRDVRQSGPVLWRLQHGLRLKTLEQGRLSTRFCYEVP